MQPHRSVAGRIRTVLVPQCDSQRHGLVVCKITASKCRDLDLSKWRELSGDSQFLCWLAIVLKELKETGLEFFCNCYASVVP